MSDYDDDMQGVLFKTDAEKMKENPKRPVMYGSLTIAGVKLNLACWKRVGNKSGKAFLSLKASYIDGETKKLVSVINLEEFEVKRDGQKELKEAEEAFADDDIPF